jgi:hypothetical protein
MKLKSPLLLCFLFVFTTKIFSQDSTDLLNLVAKDPPKKEYVYGAFKSPRIIMTHSMEMLRPGSMDFRISHRFGPVSGGLYELFGLDGAGNAPIRLGLDYGITDDLTIGLGRSNARKELDGYLKYRLIQQSKGPKSSPLSLVVIAGSTLSTLKWEHPERDNLFSSRMCYYAQAIVGRKFSEGISLQFIPSILHRNLVTYEDPNPNNLFAAGLGGRIKISHTFALTFDYHYVINQNETSPFHNPLALGFDIETGGHVFQLHFTNSKGMNERGYLAETRNKWSSGDVYFGFNISRQFQLVKKHH